MFNHIYIIRISLYTGLEFFFKKRIPITLERLFSNRRQICFQNPHRLIDRYARRKKNKSDKKKGGGSARNISLIRKSFVPFKRKPTSLTCGTFSIIMLYRSYAATVTATDFDHYLNPRGDHASRVFNTHYLLLRDVKIYILNEMRPAT